MVRKSKINQLKASTGNFSRFLIGLTETQIKSRFIHVQNQDSYISNLLTCLIIGENIIKKQNKEQNFTYILTRGKKPEFNQKLAVNEFIKNNRLFYRHLVSGTENEALYSVQAYYRNHYRITIFKDVFEATVFFRGTCSDDCKRDIYLLKSSKENEYFHVIKKPAIYFGYKYFCTKCVTFCWNKKSHFCDKICTRCCNSECDRGGTPKLCADCNRIFFGVNCFNNHTGNDVCEKLKKCTNCLLEYKYNNSIPHTCENLICGRCGIEHELGQCYILTGKEKERVRDVYRVKKTIYFDIETQMEQSGELKPVVICAAYVDKKWKCLRFKNFTEGNVADDFVNFLLGYTEVIENGKKKKVFTYKDHVVIAHNLSGFDGTFIMNSIKSRLDFKLELIKDGTRLLMLNVKPLNLKFVDSFNFVHTSLRKLSKMFGITESKTFFPYSMLKPELMNYIGPLPSKDKYEYNDMSQSEQKEFDTFYHQQQSIHRDKPFNLKTTLVEYCQKDVLVLAKSMELFRTLVCRKTGFDPFEKQLTLAGIALRDFIENHLDSHTIGIVPAKGYFSCSNQSAKAYEYLEYKSYLIKSQIRTAKHSKGEYKIGNYKIDGFCSEKKRLIDFHGCFYHGCEKCFASVDYNSSQGKLMYELRERTMHRHLEIKAWVQKNLPGYKYEYIYEHKFDEIKKTQAYKQYLVSTNRKESSPLTDATISERGFFFGGRVNATQLYLKANRYVKIHYRDINSLYPYICKYSEFPIGHPELIRDNFKKAKGTYFGIMKCRILPPTSLYHPVLPARINNKLIFPLCRTCAETESSVCCTHSKDERCLYGEWGTPEIYKAVEMGYEILDIYCVMHWKKTMKFIPGISKGLFGPYMDKWFKTKTEASGWPSDICTDQEKTDYVEMLLQNENIELDTNNIENNPGLRTLAKLFLNALWGRVAMGTERIQSKIVDKWSEMQDMFMQHGHTIEIVDYDILTKSRYLVQYRNINSTVKSNEQGNVIIGSFVTCWARLHLYAALEHLGEQVAYFDTDSLLYRKRFGENEISLGKKMGDFTDEVPIDTEISEFVGLSPKSYAIKFANGKTVVKLKGITQTAYNDDILSFESLKGKVFEMAKAGTNRLSPGIGVTTKFHLKRDFKGARIYVQPITKTLSLLYNKRVKFMDKSNPFNTYPYGYRF